MARWDIAEWVGPTPNRNAGGMVEYRGLVLHIMQGSYAGSIAWGKNPASSVSFHFATRADGHIGQLVDTVDTAWTQANGNGHWLSVENEGFSGNELTAGQLEACAQIYARGVRDYGWAYQLADGTSGRGLGWHGMGGDAWGGHPDCPGAPIVAQRQQILDRARQINGGSPNPEDDMTPEQDNILKATDQRLWQSIVLGNETYLDSPGTEAQQSVWLVKAVKDIQARLAAPVPVAVDAAAVAAALATDPTFLAAIRKVVDEELDEQSRAGADND